MKRPFKDARPIGPFAVDVLELPNKTILTEEEDDQEFILRFDLAGDVSEYNRNGVFGSYVKYAAAEQNVIHSGGIPNENLEKPRLVPTDSPFYKDSYMSKVKMQSKSRLNLSELKRDVNQRVENNEDMASAYKIEDVSIEMES